MSYFVAWRVNKIIHYFTRSQALCFHYVAWEGLFTRLSIGPIIERHSVHMTFVYDFWSVGVLPLWTQSQTSENWNNPSELHQGSRLMCDLNDEMMLMKTLMCSSDPISTSRKLYSSDNHISCRHLRGIHTWQTSRKVYILSSNTGCQSRLRLFP